MGPLLHSSSDANSRLNKNPIYAPETTTTTSDGSDTSDTSNESDNGDEGDKVYACDEDEGNKRGMKSATKFVFIINNLSDDGNNGDYGYKGDDGNKGDTSENSIILKFSKTLNNFETIF